MLKLLKDFRKPPTPPSRLRTAAERRKTSDTPMGFEAKPIKRFPPRDKASCFLARVVPPGPIACLLMLAGLTVALADAPDWENEQVLHINTDPPRATFIPFATVDGALNSDPTNSP